MEQTECLIESYRQRFKKMYAESNYEAASEAIAHLFHLNLRINLESGEDKASAFNKAKRSLISLFQETGLTPAEVSNTLA